MNELAILYEKYNEWKRNILNYENQTLHAKRAKLSEKIKIVDLSQQEKVEEIGNVSMEISHKLFNNLIARF